MFLEKIAKKGFSKKSYLNRKTYWEIKFKCKKNYHLFTFAALQHFYKIEYKPSQNLGNKKCKNEPIGGLGSAEFGPMRGLIYSKV